MKLQQLRYLCTIVDESLSITRAASNLHTSQPGVSKQLKLLEEELMTPLLVRQRNRVINLTHEAHAIIPTARRILKEVETLKQILADAGNPNKGKIVIATTHVHARYTLPPIFRKFRKEYPAVVIHLLQGSPHNIAHWVANGEADLGLGATPPDLPPGLVSIPCFRLPHCVITAPGHPLARMRRPALEVIARYPLITNGPGSRLGNLVTERFASFGLKPNIVIQTIDIEIIKKYVQQDFGVAIIPTVAVDPKMESGLRQIDASHIFEPAIASMIVQDDIPVRRYVSDFIDMLSPRRGSRRSIRDVSRAGDMGKIAANRVTSRNRP
jgi:LysR family cys regulon transcriptional activator